MTDSELLEEIDLLSNLVENLDNSLKLMEIKQNLEENKTISLLKQQNNDLLKTIKYAADIFSSYVSLHKEKGPAGEEKAANNQKHLQVMLDSINKYSGK